MPLHVALLTNMRPQRSWSPEQKQQIVLDPVRPSLSVEWFARQHGMTPSVVHHWQGDTIAENRRLQSLDMIHRPRLSQRAAIERLLQDGRRCRECRLGQAARCFIFNMVPYVVAEWPHRVIHGFLAISCLPSSFSPFPFPAA